MTHKHSQCNGEGHHHHHCEACSCPCGGACPCHAHQHHLEKGSFSKELLEVADAAWMEVLQEKIKAEIQASGGKHLEQLAKLVAEANKMRWQNKMMTDKLSDEYHTKVREFFHYKDQ